MNAITSRPLLIVKELAAALWLGAFVALAAQCQEPPDEPEPEKTKGANEVEQAWMQVFADHAKGYTIYPRGEPDEPFEFVLEPVFRHDAPSRNSDDIGGVWIWKEESGRPVVIGTIFGWTIGPNRRAVTHEFHSLSEEPIEAVWRTRDRWMPQETVTYQPIPDAPQPDASVTKRRLQTRQLARRFGAYTIDHRGNRWQLRVVPSPVYEWDDESDAQLGGAIFVICQDTNTDVVLCVEAEKTDSGAQFVYACGSFADWEAHAEIDGKEVWTARSDRYGSRGSTSVHWVRRVPTESLPANQ